MTQERTEAEQCQQAKVEDSISVASTSGMRESQNSQHPVQSENEKSFHTGTKYLILHCLNNRHSGKEKSLLCF